MYDKSISANLSVGQIIVASAERSFSKLKPIKTHLQSTYREDRLSDLVIMSIEHCILELLNNNVLIDDFPKLKTQTENF